MKTLTRLVQLKRNHKQCYLIIYQNNTGFFLIFTESLRLTWLSCLINPWNWMLRFLKRLFAGWFIFNTNHKLSLIFYSWKHWQMMEQNLLLNVKTICIVIILYNILSMKDFLHQFLYLLLGYMIIEVILVFTRNIFLQQNYTCCFLHWNSLHYKLYMINFLWLSKKQILNLYRLKGNSPKSWP